MRVCSFTVVLVLVQPFVAIICEQLVLSKRCVDKAVYERRGQVHTSRVHLGATASKPWGYRDHTRYQNVFNMYVNIITMIIIQQKQRLRLTIVFQMGFVDIIWNFGFHYVQLVTRR